MPDQKSKKIKVTPLQKVIPKVRMKATSNSKSIFGFHKSSSLLKYCEVSGSSKNPPKVSSLDGEVHVFGSKISLEGQHKDLEKSIFGTDLAFWQSTLIDQRSLEIMFLQTKRGPVWLCRPKFNTKQSKPQGSGDFSPYALMRERLGSMWSNLRDTPGMRHLGVFFHGCTNEEMMGGLVGLEMASYRFSHLAKGIAAVPQFKVSIFGASVSILKAATSMGQSINLARHFVNLDAAKLNPKTYAECVKFWFEGHKTISVDVWSPEKLKKERLNLLYAVGQAAPEKSHLVHIKYRPKGKARFKSPVAIVGKGVTFDTGGLDIKPASGMRLMKKDMGGSASVVGLANWLAESDSDVPCDIYIGLAENSVDGNAFHPGDVIIARNGTSVEIHNTDAEGRLVMADVFDVAQTQSEKPCLLIDLATLTGAMRVAVGVDIAGFFSTNDELAHLAVSKGYEIGDPCWRMPLWEGYRSHLKSSFADMSNASDSGFAGAITAGLFLQRFVKKDIPWLHFDLYCWSDRASGGVGDIGGNGQGIQLLASFLDSLKASDLK